MRGDHPRGAPMKIRFCSPIRSHMGYAEMGRIVINQLVQAGHDVAVVEIPIQASNADFGPLGAQARALVDRRLQPDVNIVNMIPPLFAQFRVPGARNIGYTVFEADRLPAGWVAMCNGMDAIWTLSEWAKAMFIASGVTVPVHVVGADTSSMGTGDEPVQRPDPDKFRLLSVFQWSERKNPVGLLRAFCAAFDGDPDATLLLKAHRFSDPARNAGFVRDAVAAVVGQMRPARALPRIEIATGFCSDRQMRELYASAHGVVGLAHAEGWGLPAWQATLAGTPVVHTGWSAPLEFIHPQGAVRSHLAPVFAMEDFVDFYDIGMRWAEPQLDHAIELLRSMRDTWRQWQDNAHAQREAVGSRYSLEARIASLRAALAA